MAPLRTRNGLCRPGQWWLWRSCRVLPSRHSFGLGQVLVSPVAHTHALQSRTPRRPRAAWTDCAALGFCSARSASSGQDRLGRFRPLGGRGHVQPRQHVMQAGDPQTQRVRAGRPAWSVSMVAGIPERKLKMCWQWPGSFLPSGGRGRSAGQRGARRRGQAHAAGARGAGQDRPALERVAGPSPVRPPDRRGSCRA